MHRSSSERVPSSFIYLSIYTHSTILHSVPGIGLQIFCLLFADLFFNSVSARRRAFVLGFMVCISRCALSRRYINRYLYYHTPHNMDTFSINTPTATQIHFVAQENYKLRRIQFESAGTLECITATTIIRKAFDRQASPITLCSEFSSGRAACAWIPCPLLLLRIKGSPSSWHNRTTRIMNGFFARWRWQICTFLL